MNRRLHIVVLAALALAAFVWWLMKRSPEQTVPAMQPSDALSISTPAAAAQTADEVPAGGAYQGLSDPRWQWWNRKRSLDRSFEWKIPIKFYGRVVDQDDQPVPGASIRYGWTAVGGSHQQLTKSDARGRFSIEGIRGKILSVDVSMEGYHSSEDDQHSFEYAAFFEADYHQPDAANPVTFRLVKKLAPEPLIVWHVSGRARYDRNYYYDVVRGKVASEPPPGAGLMIALERSEAPQGERFDWKWRIEAVNCALLETKDEIAQVAPENGYESVWKTSGAATDRPFRGSEALKLYVRTTDAHFALVEIELKHPGLRSLGPQLMIDSFLNPSGSRNLEYDPRLQIRPR